MLVWITHKKGMLFETGSDIAVTVPLASPEYQVEGRPVAETPKHLLLQSVAGCTGLDVVAILEKMRVPLPANFRIEVEAPLSGEHPKVFTAFALTYLVDGDIEAEKLIRAVTLSQEKYCGISAMFRKIAPLSWRVVLNGKEIAQGN